MADLDASMRRNDTDIRKVILALPERMEHPIHSGTPGELKLPIRTPEDLIPERTKEEEDLHVAGMKGEGVPYPVLDDDGNFVEYYVETDPSRLKVLSSPGEYHVYEVALLHRCKMKYVLSAHPWPVGFKGAPGSGRSKLISTLRT